MHNLLFILLTVTTSVLANEGTNTEATPLIEYRVTGGVAGLNLLTTVYSDGVVIETGRLEDKKTKINRNELLELKKIINIQSYSIVNKTLMPPCSVDCIYSELTVYINNEKVINSANHKQIMAFLKKIQW